jgi:hypothetical protein
MRVVGLDEREIRQSRLLEDVGGNQESGFAPRLLLQGLRIELKLSPDMPPLVHRRRVAARTSAAPVLGHPVHHGLHTQPGWQLPAFLLKGSAGIGGAGKGTVAQVPLTFRSLTLPSFCIV